MLVTGRRDGQWVEITHRSGDVLRVLVLHCQSDPPRCDLAWEDPARNFAIRRPDRRAAPGPGEGVAEGVVRA